MKNLEITSNNQTHTIHGNYQRLPFYFFYELNGDSVDSLFFRWEDTEPVVEDLEALEQEIQQYITQQ